MRRLLRLSLTFAASVQGVSDDRLLAMFSELPSGETDRTALLEMLDKSHQQLTSSGRRRTVHDVDCDSVEDQIDSIESSCVTTRYKQFNLAYPLVMQSAGLDAGIVDGVTQFNVTMDGGDVDLEGAGLRTVFGDQRTMLYGPGGTCLDPRPGSLAVTIDKLSRSMTVLVQQMNGAYDTQWRNLNFIDKREGVQFSTLTERFANVTAGLLDKMNRYYAYVNQRAQTLNANYSNSANEVDFPAFATTVNTGLAALEQLVTNAQNEDVTYKTQVEPKLTDLLNQLDALSDQFANTDATFADVVNDIGNQAAPILTAPAGKTATDPINALTVSNTANIQAFSDSSLSDVNNSRSLWVKTTLLAAQQAAADQQPHQDHLTAGSATITNSMSDAAWYFDDQTDSFSTNTSKEVSDLKSLGQDARQVVWKASSQLNNVKGSLQAIYDALAGATGQQAADLRTKVAALISSSGEASSAQLKGVLDSLSGLRQQLGSASTASDAKLLSAVSNIQGMLARAGSAQAGNGLDAQGVVAAQADLSRQLTNTAADYHQTIVQGSMGPLLDTAGANAGGIFNLSSSANAGLTGTSRDIQGAATAGAQAVQDAVYAGGVAGSHAAADVVSSLAGNATAVSDTAHSAGSTLASTHDQLSSTLSQTNVLSSGLDSSGAQTDNRASGLGDNLGDLDDAVSDQLDRQTQNAFNGASNSADRASGAVSSGVATVQSQTADQVTAAQAELDRSAAAGRQDISGAVNDNNGMGSDLDDMDSQLTGANGAFDDAMDGANTTVGRNVVSASSTALAEAAGVSADVVTAGQQAQTQASSGTAAAIKQATDTFRGKVNAIYSSGVAAASDAASRIGPVLHMSGISLDDSNSRILDKLNAGQQSLNMYANRMDSGSLSSDATTQAMRDAFAAAVAAVAKNMTDLTAGAADATQALPGNFPDGIEGALAYILNQAYGYADKVDTSANKLYGGTADAANATANATTEVVGQLSSAADDWKRGYDAAQRSAAEDSQANVNELSRLTDGAGGIAGLLASMRANQSDLQSGSSQAVATSSQDVQNMVSGIMSSLRATNGTLVRTASSGDTQAQFSSQIASGKAGRLLAALQQESVLAGGTVGDASAAVGEVTGRNSMDLHRLEAQMDADHQTRQGKLTEAIATLGSFDSGVSRNISENKDAVTMQLLMAKRAVRNLLSSWSDYVEYESGKFEKMASTDSEYMAMSGQFVDTKDGESRSKLTGSQAAMTGLNDNVQDAIGDYFQFANSTDGTVDLLSTVIPLLNASASASIGQVSESAWSFDRADADIDFASRNSSVSALQDFEDSLDRHASMALAAANGNILGSLTG